MERHRGDVDAFLDDLRAWEHDPAGFERDRARLQRIDERFFGMILAMIRGQLATGRVYVTQDVAFQDRGEDQPLARAIMSAWSLVPNGLVLELTDRPPEGNPPEPPSGERLLASRRAFESDDVVEMKVVPVYAGMHMLRGRYQASRGRHDEAIRSYERALRIRPGFAPALAAIEESRMAGRSTPGPP
jgi:hypothetical protein